jgi:hypothetical protein
VKSLSPLAPQASRHAVQKTKTFPPRNTDDSQRAQPRFAEKEFSATFGGFGEVRRMGVFL